MSPRWIISSLALSRGRAGLSAIRSAGSSKSKSATRTKRRLAAQIGLHNLGRICRRLAGRDLVDHVHPFHDPADHRVAPIEAPIGCEHDEELAVCTVGTFGASSAHGSTKERYGGELCLEVRQLGASLASTLGIAALSHETRDDPVKGEA